jgi:hypothetical protein
MYSPEQILSAAEAVYPFLPKLIDESTAADMQATLQPLIESQDIVQIWDTLNQHPQTKDFLIQYHNHIEKTKTEIQFSQIPGDQEPESSLMIYACPYCNHRATIFFFATPPTPCDQHPDAVLQRI